MRKTLNVFWSASSRLINDGGLANASNIALSLLLSLFPFLMLVAALVRLYGDPVLADQVVDILLGHWPADSAKPIKDTVETLLSQPAGEFFSFGTLVVLFLATNGLESARDGLNRAYKVEETRNFLWRRLQGALFILAGALGLIVSAFLLVGTPLVWGFLASRFDWLIPFSQSVTLAQYGLAVFILVAVLFGFHRYLPNIRVPVRQTIWGICVTIIGILLGSKLFGLYLLHIANYTALYAGLAGMMIAIVYLYFLSMLLLFGAEFNATLIEARQKKQL